jgi:broad specificity phosphatase PhoE
MDVAASIAVDVYFIRHGESYANASPSGCGVAVTKQLVDPLLTRRGIEASFANGRTFRADVLGGDAFDVVVCSPLLRTAETAYYFCGVLASVPIVVAPFLREPEAKGRGRGRTLQAPNRRLALAEQDALLRHRGYDGTLMARLVRDRLKLQADAQPASLAHFLTWLALYLASTDQLTTARRRPLRVAAFTHGRVLKREVLRRKGVPSPRNNEAFAMRVVYVRNRDGLYVPRLPLARGRRVDYAMAPVRGPDDDDANADGAGPDRVDDVSHVLFRPRADGQIVVVKRDPDADDAYARALRDLMRRQVELEELEQQPTARAERETRGPP